MKQFLWLVKFEIKKILKRKGTWITAGSLLAFLIILLCSVCFGTTEIDGKYIETHLEGFRKDAAYARALSGKSVDALLDEMQKALADAGTEDREHWYDLFYLNENLRRYLDVFQRLRLVPEMEDGNGALLNGDAYYRLRRELLEERWDAYRLTEKERAHWEAQEKKLPHPFLYQYADGYESALFGVGIYMVMLLVTFFSAVCMSGVFYEEHMKRTDQLLLCARHGKRMLYFAKITAGSAVSVVYAGLMLGITFGVNFLISGNDGFHAMLQIYAPFTSKPVSIGVAALAASGVALAGALLTAVFTMTLSELLRHNIGALSVAVAAAFLARMVSIPPRMRVLSQIWNYMPVNLCAPDGLFDYRLVPFPFVDGLESMQAAPLLWLALTALFVWAGWRAYCAYQVRGR